MLTSSLATANTMKGSSMHTKQQGSNYVSQLKSHLNLSQVYESKGWDEVASSIAYSEAEFCYVTPDESDFYKFHINDTVPRGIVNNQYLTLSRNGILQSTADGAELLTYPNLMREHDIYHKLKSIPVFGAFRLWKPFRLWTKAVRGRKMTAAVSTAIIHHSKLDILIMHAYSYFRPKV